MLPQGKGMELTLYAHGTHLFPAFHGAHGGISVSITVEEKCGSRFEIKGEFRVDDIAIFVASFLV